MGREYNNVGIQNDIQNDIPVVTNTLSTTNRTWIQTKISFCLVFNYSSLVCFGPRCCQLKIDTPLTLL